MGVCDSKSIPHTQLEEEEHKNSKQLKMANSEVKARMSAKGKSIRKEKKLLLLGTGSSGKSTLFKSIDNTSAKQATLTNLRQNVISCTLTLLKQTQKLYESDNEKFKKCLIDLNNADITKAIQVVVSHGSAVLTDEDAMDDQEFKHIGVCIYIIWSLEAIQFTFSCRGSTYCFPDNMDYFFEKSKQVFEADYIPTKEDELKVRVRTTGINSTDYVFKDTKFKLFDVGGQRNERKKWIHHFDNVAAVLFVMALNHYDAVMFEDETKNAMHETVELFAQLINAKFFRKSEIIIFLNKDDLFRLKILQQVSLNVCFSPNAGWKGIQWPGPEYQPSNDETADAMSFMECYEAAIAFIQNIFITMNTVQNRVVFCHVTCATDSQAVSKVFRDVQNCVIRSNLRKGGLMS